MASRLSNGVVQELCCYYPSHLVTFWLTTKCFLDFSWHPDRLRGKHRGIQLCEIVESPARHTPNHSAGFGLNRSSRDVKDTCCARPRLARPCPYSPASNWLLLVTSLLQAAYGPFWTLILAQMCPVFSGMPSPIQSE
ncbi:hypothetical protein Tsp_02546 [Trichinella spiralis]|uniref:hypothetical protein n=1 Tax=Trichinella spiralis TaxID=6334 RepID=UPI0001EFB5E7|nr:hypothetical protein Tsp_02546 [Trichinella spiralis]